MEIIGVLLAIVILSCAWNWYQGSRAKSGVSLEFPHDPDRVSAAVTSALIRTGAKGALANAARGVTVQPSGRNAFRYGTKIGDEGRLVIQASRGGSIVVARTERMFVGWHRNPSARSGFYQLVFALTALFTKLLYYRPGASKMWRFQRALEGRLNRELRRGS